MTRRRKEAGFALDAGHPPGESRDAVTRAAGPGRQDRLDGLRRASHNPTLREGSHARRSQNWFCRLIRPCGGLRRETLPVRQQTGVAHGESHAVDVGEGERRLLGAGLRPVGPHHSLRRRQRAEPTRPPLGTCRQHSPRRRIDPDVGAALRRGGSASTLCDGRAKEGPLRRSNRLFEHPPRPVPPQRRHDASSRQIAPGEDSAPVLCRGPRRGPRGSRLRILEPLAPRTSGSRRPVRPRR